MKTVYLSDDEFKELAGALANQVHGKEVLIEFLSGRFGTESDQVRKETAALKRITEAALSFHGLSTWRSNSGRAKPASIEIH